MVTKEDLQRLNDRMMVVATLNKSANVTVSRSLDRARDSDSYDEDIELVVSLVEVSSTLLSNVALTNDLLFYVLLSLEGKAPIASDSRGY